MLYLWIRFLVCVSYAHVATSTALKTTGHKNNKDEPNNPFVLHACMK